MLKKLLYITLCVVLLLTGCSLSGTGSVKGEQKTAMVYYANAEGTDLVSAEIDVRDKTEKELPRYVIETLLEGPSSADMSRSVRAGTKLLSLITEKSLARVDLSKEFYHEESVLDVLSIAAIVKSLCSVNSIDQRICIQTRINKMGWEITAEQKSAAADGLNSVVKR